MISCSFWVGFNDVYNAWRIFYFLRIIKYKSVCIISNIKFIQTENFNEYEKYDISKYSKFSFLKIHEGKLSTRWIIMSLLFSHELQLDRFIVYIPFSPWCLFHSRGFAILSCFSRIPVINRGELISRPLRDTAWTKREIICCQRFSNCDERRGFLVLRIEEFPPWKTSSPRRRLRNSWRNIRGIRVLWSKVSWVFSLGFRPSKKRSGRGNF